jgi:hypothetical protein
MRGSRHTLLLPAFRIIFAPELNSGRPGRAAESSHTDGKSMQETICLKNGPPDSHFNEKYF